MVVPASAKTSTPVRVLGRYGLLLLLALNIVGCVVQQTLPVKRIALLAPFEGRYREVGYQALYAARMAIAETRRTDLELYAIDDGGSVETALFRAQALQLDTSIKTVLVLGIYAVDERVLAQLEGIPTQIIGRWEPVWGIEDITITAPHELLEIAQLDVEYNCGDICLLTTFPLLVDNPTLATISTDSPPITNDFRQRYIQFDQFAPEPLPIALATYLTMRHTIDLLSGRNPEKTNDTQPEYIYKYSLGGNILISESTD